MIKILNVPFYFCSNCRIKVEKIDDLYFVEETSSRGFCSEKCIEEYYSPLIDIFETLKTQLRQTKKCLEPDLEEYLTQPDLLDQLFLEPDEIWIADNLLKDEINFLIKTVEIDKQKLYLVAGCLIFQYKPSFVFSVDITASKDIVNAYKIGQKVDDLNPYRETASIQSKSNMEMLEQFKSSLLAELLEIRKNTDIQVESFHLYESYVFPTKDNPDTLTAFQNKDGEDFIVCTKAYEMDGNSFFYIVVCLDISGELQTVLSFPTLDGALYKYYTRGKQVGGALKN